MPELETSVFLSGYWCEYFHVALVVVVRAVVFAMALLDEDHPEPPTFSPAPSVNACIVVSEGGGSQELYWRPVVGAPFQAREVESLRLVLFLWMLRFLLLGSLAGGDRWWCGRAA